MGGVIRVGNNGEMIELSWKEAELQDWWELEHRVRQEGWGNWYADVENPDHVFIVYRPNEYDIEINGPRCNSKEHIADWMFHMARKPWASAEDLGNLFRGMIDLMRFDNHRKAKRATSDTQTP